MLEQATEMTFRDTVTAHDKKRNYLECLEQYIQYLQEQARLAGLVHLPLARFNEYRGLSSRSARVIILILRFDYP